jgi:hypothetical protein
MNPHLTTPPRQPKPIRQVTKDGPLDEHRMDLYPLFGAPIQLEPAGGITRRHFFATDAAKQISRSWGLPEESTVATKVSKFESPEKWILMNEGWKARGEIMKHYAETVGQGCRIRIWDGACIPPRLLVSMPSTAEGCEVSRRSKHYLGI